ncbi:MAG: EcsC family protein [Acidobacteriales bacterium]|nr:EcsC family protein [Terriglobales bacterium]
MILAYALQAPIKRACVKDCARHLRSADQKRNSCRASESLSSVVGVTDSIQVAMIGQTAKSWLRRRIESGLQRGFQRAYQTVRVNPSKFLFQLRAGYGLPISTFQGVYSVDVERLDQVAQRIIHGGMKTAAAEGAGFGMGGLLTIVPDLGILSAITLRMIQKLSLLYGFEISSDEETAELWIAAASAAGVDISRELLEKEVVNRFVPRVIQKIAAKAGAEVVEKWSGRLIPFASSVIGAGLNYYFVRAWGERARAHFRQRHLDVRKLASVPKKPVVLDFPDVQIISN